LAVTNVEALGFDAPIINVNAAVGQYAIHIEQQQFDARRFLTDGAGDALHEKN
jgi:hypothetical protein